MKENQMADLRKQLDNMEKQQTELLGMGDQAKFSHLNQIKQQKNQEAKKLMELQNEYGKLKQELQRWKQLKKEEVSFINWFGD